MTVLSWLEDTLIIAAIILLVITGTGIGIFSFFVMFAGIVSIFAYGIGHILTALAGLILLLIAISLWRGAVAFWYWTGF